MYLLQKCYHSYQQSQHEVINLLWCLNSGVTNKPRINLFINFSDLPLSFTSILCPYH